MMEEGKTQEGLHYLRLEAQKQLRKDIRQENKEGTAVMKDVVVPIGGIIISILSLLIGLRCPTPQTVNQSLIQSPLWI
jgi:hypothetical protein